MRGLAALPVYARDLSDFRWPSGSSKSGGISISDPGKKILISLMKALGEGINIHSPQRGPE